MTGMPAAGGSAHLPMHVPLLALAVALPFVLLLLMLGMELVERPLRRGDASEELLEFLDRAQPEEVETFVREGYSPALEKYWNRRRPGRLRVGRSR